MKCKYCESINITKAGMRRQKQSYKCHTCHKVFVEEDGRTGRSVKYNQKDIIEFITEQLKVLYEKRTKILKQENPCLKLTKREIKLFRNNYVILKDVYEKKQDKNFISRSYYQKMLSMINDTV